MRISDWSSDVCSADLPSQHLRGVVLQIVAQQRRSGKEAEQGVDQQHGREDRGDAARAGRVTQLLCTSSCGTPGCTQRRTPPRRQARPGHTDSLEMLNGLVRPAPTSRRVGWWKNIAPSGLTGEHRRTEEHTYELPTILHKSHAD